MKKYILVSCQVPFVISTTFFKTIEGDNYLDGGTPFIFNNRCIDDRRILHLNTMYITRVLNISKEKNSSTRVLEGALQLHKFLMYNEKVPLCKVL